MKPLLFAAIAGFGMVLPGYSAVSLIEPGSIWRYVDTGADLGESWRQSGFLDEDWDTGPAQLGYGEGDESSRLANAAAGEPITIYFRRSFVVSNRAEIRSLTVRLILDDGAIIYLNGREAARINLPSGPVRYLTPAVAPNEQEPNRLEQYGLYPGWLQTGTNWIAVEVHQAEATRSAFSFDLELVANLPVLPPNTLIISPTNGQILAPESITPIEAVATSSAGHMDSVEFLVNGQKVGTDRVEPFAYDWGPVAPGRYRLQAHAIDYQGWKSFSEPIYVQVGSVEPLRVLRGPYLQTSTSNSIVVRWRTDWFSDAWVRYGSAIDQLTTTAGRSAFATEHQVQLTNLLPDTQYYYSIGTSNQVLVGGVDCFFRTAPAVNRAIRVWVIGDSGTANTNAAAVRDGYLDYVGSRYTDVWLMLGDNAYESGTDDEYQAAVFDMYPSLLRQTVLWPTLGNHDAAYLDANGRLPYFDMFTLPEAGQAGGLPSGTQRYYSFDYANVHFVCLDSQLSDRSRSGAMLKWLQEDLATTAQDWIFAYWHHPPYSKGSYDSDRVAELGEIRTQFLPLLEAYGVDLVLAGHSHVYERSMLLDGHYGSSSNLTSAMILDGGSGRELHTGAYHKPAGGLGSRSGAVYIVCGCSGEGGPFRYGIHPVMYESFNGFGSVVLEVEGGRLEAKFLRPEGRIDDWFTLLKVAANETTRPVLQMVPSSSGTFELVWPTSLPPFGLEKTFQLGTSPQWHSLPSPAATGRHYRVPVNNDVSNAWFRLRAIE